MMRRRGRLQGTRYQRAEGVQHSVAELLQLARLPRPAPDHGCESLLRVPQGGQRYGPPPQSAGGGWGNPVAFAVPGYRDSIRPHSRRGVVVGAETTRVGGGGGLQRLAIVSRHEAVGGVRDPPRVQRVGRLRAEAAAVVPSSRTFSSRGTHQKVSWKPPSICASRRATASACSEGLADPPETNSPSRLQPTANGGITPAEINTQPLVVHHHPVVSSREEGAGSHEKGQQAPQLPQGGAIVPQQRGGTRS